MRISKTIEYFSYFERKKVRGQKNRLCSIKAIIPQIVPVWGGNQQK